MIIIVQVAYGDPHDGLYPWQRAIHNLPPTRLTWRTTLEGDDLLRHLPDPGDRFGDAIVTSVTINPKQRWV